MLSHHAQGKVRRSVGPIFDSANNCCSPIAVTALFLRRNKQLAQNIRTAVATRNRNFE